MLKLPAESPDAKTRPEAELLLCCTPASLGPERARRIKSLVREGINWNYLLWIAQRHAMMPLLYWHLDAIRPDGVPRITLDALREHFHTNTQRNLFLTGELFELLDLLKAQGIPAIPYKGPVLAASVYGNIALRQFCDLDILVRKQDVPRVKDLLVAQGYRTPFQLIGAQQMAYLRSGYELGFRRDADGIQLEIQWQIVPRFFSFSHDPKQFWKRVRLVPLGGRQIPSLSPEDLLLVLCVHGSKHLWQRLDWICGVAELIRTHQKMDWIQVTEQASILGIRRILFLGLLLASQLLGAALPGELAQSLYTEAAVRRLAMRVRQQLFSEAPGSAKLFQQVRFHLRARERFQDRARYCFRLALTPSVGDITLWPLPAFLFFLYFLLRPIRLLGKYGLRVFRRKSVPVHQVVLR